MKKILYLIIIIFYFIYPTRLVCKEIFFIEDIAVLQKNNQLSERSVSRIIDPELGVICYEYYWGKSEGVTMSCIPFSFFDPETIKKIRNIIKDRKEDKNKIIKE